MASGRTFILKSEASRDLACALILQAEIGSTVVITPPKKTREARRDV